MRRLMPKDISKKEQEKTMNDADFKLLEAEAFASVNNAAMAQAIIRMQRDLSVMLEKVNRLESYMIPPNGWPDYDDEFDQNSTPF